MFAPVSFQDISFPERAVMGNLDMIPEAFGAWNQYSNQATASVPTTSSYFTTSLSGSGAAIPRWGLGANNRLLGVAENGTTAYIWDANTNTEVGSVALTNPGTIRKVVYDNLTNSWVVCGSNNFIKVNCDTTASTNIAVPTNTGNNYPSVVAFNGKAYGLPLVSVASTTRVAIFDLLANTSTTSSVTLGASAGTAGYWGAVLNSIGTIYFFKEAGATGTAIYEYLPSLDTGSFFGTMTSSPGYFPTNLPDGRVWTGQYGNSGSYYINPNDKQITNISGSINFGLSGVCVGQDGKVYTLRSSTGAAGISTLIYFNPKNNVTTSMTNQIIFTRPTSGDRGYQDLVQLSDGRMVVLSGQNNSGRLVYVNYLASGNDKNNGYTSAGMTNPIMITGQGV